MKVYRIAAAICLTILVAGSIGAMTTYALSEASCIKAGFDGGEPVKSGPYKEMYKCTCRSTVKQIAVEKQYEVVLTNIYQNKLTFAVPRTSPIMGKKLPIAISPIADRPVSAASQPSGQQ